MKRIFFVKGGNFLTAEYVIIHAAEWSDEKKSLIPTNF